MASTRPTIVRGCCSRSKVLRLYLASARAASHISFSRRSDTPASAPPTALHNPTTLRRWRGDGWAPPRLEDAVTRAIGPWIFGDRLTLQIPALQSRAMDQSIRGDKRVRNAEADLAIVADRAGMERQKGVFHHVLRNGLAC